MGDGFSGAISIISSVHGPLSWSKDPGTLELSAASRSMSHKEGGWNCSGNMSMCLASNPPKELLRQSREWSLLTI